MNKKEFEGFNSIQYWMNSMPGRDGLHTTKYQWKLRVKKFCEWANKTPDILIAERKKDMENEDERIRHSAEMRVKKFIKSLEEKGLSPNSRRNYFSAIRSFYKRNYQELTFFRGDGPKPETVTDGARAANKEDIRKMVELCKPRDKSIILFIKDTGLSESDVAKLKLKHLGLKDVSEIFTIKPPITITTKRTKTGYPTITFMGKEALDAFRASLRIRIEGSPELKIRRYGRHEVKRGIPPEKLTLESPVFRSFGRFLQTIKEEKKPVNHLRPHSISVIVRKAAIRAGVWSEGFSAHALRRFFQTSLESAGLNQNWIKKMTGHKLPGVEGSYSKPEIKMLREAYQKSYDFLAVTETAEQKSRVETLENQVEKLILNGKQKEQKITKLEQQNQLLQKQVSGLLAHFEVIVRVPVGTPEKELPTQEEINEGILEKVVEEQAETAEAEKAKNEL